MESSDLAENLGLLPMGSANNSDVPISVAELLAKENAARAAIAEATRGPTSWAYIPGGAFVNHR